MIPNYQIVVRNKTGEILGEFSQWKDFHFSDKVNFYGECSFSIPVDSDELETLVSLRRYEVVIKREGKEVWAGEQVNRNVNLRADSSNRVTIVCYTFLEMFNARLTPAFVRYQDTDQGEILKALVDDSQVQTEGDFGFTFGDYLTGTLTNVEYSNQSIMDAFIDMSETINGPDFYIDFDKVINIVPFRGVDRSRSIVLEWGTNLSQVGIDENFVNPCNEARALGGGFGSSQQIATFSDASAKAVYKLRQQRLSEVNVQTSDFLGDTAEAFIRKNKSPILSLDIEQMPGILPTFGSISLGDSVRVKVKEGIYNINNIFRVYGYSVSISEDGKENVSYLVSNI